MQTKAVLFDLDGTLVDSLPTLTCSLNVYLAALGKAPFTEKEVSDMVGKGVRVLLQKAFACRQVRLAGASFDAAVKDYIAQCLKTGNGKTRVFPGVAEALGALRSKGIETALVTNKSRAMTLSLLADKGLAPLFDVVVAGDDGHTPKPAPDMLLVATAALGASAADCVMVGDSRNDALAARSAKMTVRLVACGYNEGEPIGQWAQANGFDAPFPATAQAVAGLC